jgi:copper chaperone
VLTQYKVDGMTCGHCVNAVTEEVSALPGVEDVEVDLNDGLVSVRSGQALDFSAVDAAVDEAGYKLVKQL